MSEYRILLLSSSISVEEEVGDIVALQIEQGYIAVNVLLKDC